MFLLLATALLPVSVSAAGLPADCSAATIPAGPVKGSIAAVPFVPSDSWVAIGKSGLGINGVHFDTYRFQFDGQDKDGDRMSLDVTIIVTTGTKPDGKLFKLLPTDDIDKQPQAGPGAPAVQGWSLEYDAKKIGVDFIDTIGSMRLELDQRKGKKLPGRIYFCIPSAGASFLAGSFSATLQ